MAKHKKPALFADLFELPEDERIALIGNTVMNGRKKVGVFVDAISGKAERYIAKLKKQFPDIVIESTHPNQTPGCTLIKIAPPVHKDN